MEVVIHCGSFLVISRSSKCSPIYLKHLPMNRRFYDYLKNIYIYIYIYTYVYVYIYYKCEYETWLGGREGQKKHLVYGLRL